MRWIVDTALRLRFVVVALAFVLLVAGTRAAMCLLAARAVCR